MLLYIRIDDALKGRVDELVVRGLYPDFNSVAMVALQNLLVAEEEAATHVRGDAPMSPPPIFAAAKAKAPPATAKTEPKGIRWDRGATVPKKLIVPFPADLFDLGQIVPVERWIFGQQNRALPAKVNARLFGRLISERGSEVELFEAALEVSTRATHVFGFLNGLDERFGHGKDDLLTTGFPEPGSEKAISRYANHFVAYESTQGNLTGMLLQWKLIGIKRHKNKTYLLPTQACLDFAELENPLLDEPVHEKAGEKFSQKEITWAVEHIRKHVPVEASAFTTILVGLSERFITPDALDGFVREHAKGKDDISPAFISTQRSGAISRMADLHLVRRKRAGTKVAYEITELGTNWLKDSKQKSTNQNNPTRK